jgi:hypothetical protein
MTLSSNGLVAIIGSRIGEPNLVADKQPSSNHKNNRKSEEVKLTFVVLFMLLGYGPHEITKPGKARTMTVLYSSNSGNVKTHSKTYFGIHTGGML